MSDFGDFLDRLSSAEPVPGGGSVAALQAAMGASLLAMVMSLTLGRKRFADVQEQAAELRDLAIDLRDRASALAEEDIAAFRRVSDAMALPRDTDEEKEARRVRLQAALKGAAVPPLDTMRVASSIVTLARQAAAIGNPSAISDVGTAVLAARAAYHGARLNVEINAAAIKDTAWVEQLRADMAVIGDPDREEGALLASVLGRIRGESA